MHTPYSLPTESQEQKLLIRWADLQPWRDYLIHIPNGGSRHKLEARNLRLMGVRAGVLDLFLAIPKNGKHGLWIEMKRVKRCYITPPQKRYITLLSAQGYEVIVAHGFEEAKNVILNYLNH